MQADIINCLNESKFHAIKQFLFSKTKNRIHKIIIESIDLITFGKTDHSSIHTRRYSLFHKSSV